MGDKAVGRAVGYNRAVSDPPPVVHAWRRPLPCDQLPYPPVFPAQVIVPFGGAAGLPVPAPGAPHKESPSAAEASAPTIIRTTIGQFYVNQAVKRGAERHEVQPGFEIVPCQHSETVRPEGDVPENPCNGILTHPEPPVHAAGRPKGRFQG